MDPPAGSKPWWNSPPVRPIVRCGRGHDLSRQKPKYPRWPRSWPWPRPRMVQCHCKRNYIPLLPGSPPLYLLLRCKWGGRAGHVRRIGPKEANMKMKTKTYHSPCCSTNSLPFHARRRNQGGRSRTTTTLPCRGQGAEAMIFPPHQSTDF